MPLTLSAERFFPPLTEQLVNGIGAATNSKNSKRIMPRSPRTALEPDQVEMPARRSKSARNPLVIVGNAIISLFVLAMPARFRPRSRARNSGIQKT